LLSDPNYLSGWFFISESQRAEITLMNSLNRIKGCPLYVYDTVVEWARATLSTPINSLEYDSPLPLIRSREKFLKTSPIFAHTQNMKPVTNTIKLPGCSKQVSVTTTSYSANLYNFLTNPDLVNDHTLIIPGNTPHDDLPEDRPSVYDDVDSGSRFQDSFTFMKREAIDFPFGDIFFVDNSYLDVSGRIPYLALIFFEVRLPRQITASIPNLGCIRPTRHMTCTRCCAERSPIRFYHLQVRSHGLECIVRSCCLHNNKM
jgi:hypothetical protein